MLSGLVQLSPQFPGKVKYSVFWPIFWTTFRCASCGDAIYGRQGCQAMVLIPIIDCSAHALGQLRYVASLLQPADSL